MTIHKLHHVMTQSIPRSQPRYHIPAYKCISSCTGCGKKSSPWSFSLFSQRPLV